MAESGLTPSGEWVPEFEEQRRTHDAYSKAALEPATAEIADELRELMPVYTEAFEPAVQLAAVTIAQARLAHRALVDEEERSERLRLSQDARGWLLLAREQLSALGLTPKARAELGLTLDGRGEGDGS